MMKIEGRKVLVLEDNPVNRLVLKENLERMGFVVVDYPNPIRAIAEDALLDADLIVSDYFMNGMNGGDFVDLLDNQRLTEAPVIFFTGHDINNGFRFRRKVRTVKKPDIEGLLKAIREI